jgi:signal transduction histidine kinase/ligand-binding sensor domain-containing protein
MSARGLAFSALRAWIALLLVAAAARPAWALDPSVELGQLHHTRWTPREGAPAGITALAQTADGLLWLGTNGGLVSFDGATFRHSESPDGEPRVLDDVSALHAGREGELWVGLRMGGAHRIEPDGRMQSFGLAQGLPSASVLAFAQDRDGIVWAATSRGLYRLDGGHWNRVGREAGLGLEDARSVLVDGDGTLWASGEHGTWRRPAGSPRFDVVIDGAPGAGILRSDRAGRAWLQDDAGLTTLGARRRTIAASSLGGRVEISADFLFDRDGGLWMLLSGGVVRLPREPEAATGTRLLPQRFRAGEGPTGEIVWTMLEDREGDLWLATNGGLDRLRDVRFHPAADARSPLIDAALALTQDGRASIASNRGEVVPHAPARAASLPAGFHLTSLSIAPDGTEWLGGSGALSRGDASGRWTSTLLPAQGGDVQASAVDAAGALWISQTQGGGVWRRDAGAWVRNGGYPQLPLETAVSLAAGGDGALWIGFAHDRVGEIRGGTARTWEAADGLRIGATLAITPAAGHTWIGGSRGVAAVARGHVHPVRLSDRRPLNGVSGIVETPDGALWLNGAGGVTVAGAEAVRRWLAHPDQALEADLLDHEDGLDGIAPYLQPVPSMVRDAAGRIWVATNRNVFWIDPAHVRRNPVAPTVRVLGIEAGGRSWRPDARIELPARTAQFRIDYTGISLAEPQRVRFQYRLEGVDAGWQEAGAHRQAFYTNVGPGRYVFRLRAANEDGVWSGADAELAFVVLPAFWQTAWFRAAVTIAILALAWFALSLRMRQVAARARAEVAARTAERERIARELHDTLLQGTQGLVFSLQGLAARLPPGDPTREGIEERLDRADQVLVEARERVSDLRTSRSAAGLLPDMLGELGSTLGAERGVAFRLVIEGEPQELERYVRDECYHIAREALVNAFSHARARTVEARTIYRARSMLVVVRDDGVGIARETLDAGARKGHWGLPGMRERARALGARFHVWSRAGLGTEIALAIPSRVAYAAPHASTASRRWRFLPTPLPSR